MADTQTPPMKKSEESEPKQLKLAAEQGKAYVKALDEMAHNEAHDGGQTQAGDYAIAYAIEEAEGMYHYEGGDLKWRNPQEENAHVEISVRDRADNRFIPGLKVTATLIDADGKTVGTHEQPFLWHPWIYHYGRNWKVPGDGNYTLKVRVDPPTFPRHDHENGRRYAEPIEVEFKNVNIKTGQKRV